MDKNTGSFPVAVAVAYAHGERVPDWADELGLQTITLASQADVESALKDHRAHMLLDFEDGLRIYLRKGPAVLALTPQEAALLILYAVGSHRKTPDGIVVTTVADFPNLEHLADEWGLPTIRTLPGQEHVRAEVMERPEPFVFGFTVAHGNLCPVLKKGDIHLVAEALINVVEQGIDIPAELSSRLYGQYACATDVSVRLASPVECAFRLMDIRAEDSKLFCHMVVTDALDYLPGLAMPGAPNRHLDSCDLIIWTLSDTSRIAFMADESSEEVVVRIQAHGDTRQEAEVVLEALALEAATYVKEGPRDLTEED